MTTYAAVRKTHSTGTEWITLKWCTQNQNAAHFHSHNILGKGRLWSRRTCQGLRLGEVVLGRKNQITSNGSWLYSWWDDCVHLSKPFKSEFFIIELGLLQWQKIIKLCLFNIMVITILTRPTVVICKIPSTRVCYKRSCIEAIRLPTETMAMPSWTPSELYVILFQLHVILGYAAEEEGKLKQRLHPCGYEGVITRVGIFIDTAVLGGLLYSCK